MARRRLLRATWIAAVVVSWPLSASSYFIDDDGTVQLLGRAYSQTALRTETSSGFTFPRTPAGHVVQHRSLFELEVAHRLDRALPSRPAWLGDLGYRLRFKGVTEGLYDYGPEEYSDQVEVNPPSPFDPAQPAVAPYSSRSNVAELFS